MLSLAVGELSWISRLVLEAVGLSLGGAGVVVFAGALVEVISEATLEMTAICVAI